MSKKEFDPVRQLALNTILKVEQGFPLQEILSASLSHSSLNQKQKNLCSDLVYGFFRSRIKLEFILQQFLSKFHKLPESMQILLELAIYSFLFQDSANIYVIADKTVDRIKKLYGINLSRVANASLRAILRSGDEINQWEWFLCKCNGNYWKAMASYWAMPEEIINLWRDAYGDDAAYNLIKRSSNRPWTGLQINMHHSEAEKIKMVFKQLTTQDVEFIGELGVAVAPGSLSKLDVNLTSWLQNGALKYQAAGSMLVLEKLNILEWQTPVWDCCAGAGGKSLTLLNAGINIKLVSDTSFKRLKTIKNNYSGDAVLANAAMPPLKKWQGNIIADVPCSGLGVLARRPDLRHNFKQRQQQDYSLHQLAILNGIMSTIDAGGKIAYITCTLNPAENELLIKKFLNMHSNAILERQWQTPFNHPWLEGMFGAVIKKDSL